MTENPINPRIAKKQRIFRALEENDTLTLLARKAYAIMFAATPSERWEMHVRFLRSIGLWGLAARRHAGLGDSYEAQKESWPAAELNLRFQKYLAARHGFEP
jgi:hypothetical protein